MKIEIATECKRVGTPNSIPLFMIRCDIGRARIGSRTAWITWGMNLKEDELEPYAKFSGIKGFVFTGATYELEIDSRIAKNIPLSLTTKKGKGWTPCVGKAPNSCPVCGRSFGGWKNTASAENGKKGGRPKARFITRDSEAGNRIEGFDTLTEARAAIAEYEQEDRAEGTYTEGFYEVAELDSDGDYMTVQD